MTLKNLSASKIQNVLLLQQISLVKKRFQKDPRNSNSSIWPCLGHLFVIDQSFFKDFLHDLNIISRKISSSRAQKPPNSSTCSCRSPNNYFPLSQLNVILIITLTYILKYIFPRLSLICVFKMSYNLDTIYYEIGLYSLSWPTPILHVFHSEL